MAGPQQVAGGGDLGLDHCFRCVQGLVVPEGGVPVAGRVGCLVQEGLGAVQGAGVLRLPRRLGRAEQDLHGVGGLLGGAAPDAPRPVPVLGGQHPCGGCLERPAPSGAGKGGQRGDAPLGGVVGGGVPLVGPVALRLLVLDEPVGYPAYDGSVRLRGFGAVAEVGVEGLEGVRVGTEGSGVLADVAVVVVAVVEDGERSGVAGPVDEGRDEYGHGGVVGVHHQSGCASDALGVVEAVGPLPQGGHAGGRQAGTGQRGGDPEPLEDRDRCRFREEAAVAVCHSGELVGRTLLLRGVACGGEPGRGGGRGAAEQPVRFGQQGVREVSGDAFEGVVELERDSPAARHLRATASGAAAW